MRDALAVGQSIVATAGLWIFVAFDRPRVIARHPDREGRVDVVLVRGLRAVVFGPLALPFYLLRSRGLRAVGIGLLIIFGLFWAAGSLPEALSATVLAAVLVGVAAIIERIRWRRSPVSLVSAL